MRIRELPLSEQPKQRLLVHGAAVLSDAELLSLIGGFDTLVEAQAAITAAGSVAALQGMSAAEVQAAGLGPGGAVRVLAALELGRRLHGVPGIDRVQISSPADAAQFLLPRMRHLVQEEFVVVGLDAKNRVRLVETLYRGTVDSAMVRPAEVFRSAVRQNLRSIMVAHNHPSGDVVASPEDVLLTRQIVQAGELLDIQLVDHLIIGDGCWVSLRERRLGFSV